MKFVLAHDLARQRARQAVNEAPEGYVVTISEPSKSRAQEEHYHALIGDIARVFRWQGKQLDPETMKRLLVDQFRADTLRDPQLAPKWHAMQQVEMMPSLDGSRIVVLGTQTRRFPRELASAFIEWLKAFEVETAA